MVPILLVVNLTHYGCAHLMSSVRILFSGFARPICNYLGTDLSMSQLDKFHYYLSTYTFLLPWSLGIAPSISFVWRFKLALLPETNLLVVVFIKSFP